MKIAYVSTYLPQRCGIAAYTNYLISGIKMITSMNGNIDIKVIAEDGARPVKTNGFEVLPCWSREKDYTEKIIDNIRDVDIIHIQHEYNIYKLDETLPNLLKKINKKKVITIHCIRSAHISRCGLLEESYIERIANLSDAIILHLDAQKSILTRLGIPTDKIYVIPHGTVFIDVEKEYAQKKLKFDKKGKLLLMFGFIKPHKCVHVAIEALREVLKKIEDVNLFIAGGLKPLASEEEKKYLEFINQQIEKYNLSDRVIFTKRFISDDELMYLLGAADVVLFPYYEEDRSASGALHLAIGAKKPVITSRIAKFEEVKEICEELLVLPYNSKSIANLVIRLFTDRDFLEYIVKKIERYREITSWSKVAKKHLHLYTQLQQNKK